MVNIQWLGRTCLAQKIVELPLNGRNVMNLGLSLPGVVAAPAALGGASGDATPGGFGAPTAGFSVNGQRNQSNNFLLDGTSNNDTFNTGFVLRPPPDAIQEFKILTHSYSAAYGHNSGSVVNVVTRSGSNELHGAVWEFNRDDTLQARNFFAPSTQSKLKLKQNTHAHGRDCRARHWRLAAERHRADADGVSHHRHRSPDQHPISDESPRSDVRSQRQCTAYDYAVVRYVLFRPAFARRHRRARF